MNCQNCQHRKNGMCTKYDKRLLLIDVFGSFVLFYKLDECDIQNSYTGYQFIMKNVAGQA